MSTKTVRVLHIIGAMDYGGIETWLMHVLRHINRTKFQFDFCYTKPEPGAYALEIEALGGRMVACLLKKSNPLSFARRFRSVLREGRYDVVHSHVHHFSGFVVRLAHQEQVPVRIAHCHNTSDGKGSGPSRILYHALMKHWIRKYATHGLAASQDAARALFGPNWQSDPRFRVLHCGIDLEPFRQEVSREPVRQELGIPLDAPVVGHVGRFVPQKNHTFLLEIAAEVVKLRTEVRFLLVGDGPLATDPGYGTRPGHREERHLHWRASRRTSLDAWCHGLIRVSLPLGGPRNCSCRSPGCGTALRLFRCGPTGSGRGAGCRPLRSVVGGCWGVGCRRASDAGVRTCEGSGGARAHRQG